MTVPDEPARISEMDWAVDCGVTAECKLITRLVLQIAKTSTTAINAGHAISTSPRA